jgi:hypothetical protein
MPVMLTSPLAVARHRREVRAITEQHLASSCAHSLCAPQDETWPHVINRLTLWLERLQSFDPGRTRGT